MKPHHSSQNIRQADTASVLVQLVKPDIIVHSGISELDGLLDGFKAGEITLIDGNSELIADLPNRLCVNTYKTFQSDTIYIDGGMCADPYKIARYARIAELDQRETLHHTKISRAFTVYQLSTLLRDMLEPMLKHLRPRTLIIGMFPVLYGDPDVAVHEAQLLFKQDVEKIKELTIKYDLITIITNLDVTSLSTSKGIGKTLYAAVDEIVRMKQFDQCTSLELVKKQKSTTIVRFAEGQLRLEEFGMVI